MLRSYVIENLPDPFSLPALNFLGWENNSSLPAWGETPGHKSGTSDGPLRGPAGIASVQRRIRPRPEKAPIRARALPYPQIRRHILPAQPLAREDSKFRFQKIRQLPFKTCPVLSFTRSLQLKSCQNERSTPGTTYPHSRTLTNL